MWGTFDIETLTYIDGVLVDTETLEAEARKMNDAEKRRRVSVDVALLQVYTETLGFKMFQGANKWEDMLAYCAYERITTLWNYNAVFDFANMDYWLLNNPNAERMKTGDELDKENNEQGGVYHKIGAKNLGGKILFKELSGNMGQRYMYELHYKARGKNRHTRAFKLVFYDFRNILKGGLKKILEELDVEDNDGNKLRKLSMEYQAVDYTNLTAEEYAYVEADVKGLYFAIKQFNWELVNATNGRRNLIGSKPSGLTASGIAKKELLYFVEGYARDDINVKHYRRKHPITLKQDIYLRETKLYRGGICYLNSNYCNIPIERVFYRYDVNSEYPSVMHDMRDLYGKLERCSYQYYQTHKCEKNKCFIFRFSYLSWTTKKGKVPIFTNPFTGKNDISGVIQKGVNKNKHGFCMFEEEFNTLCDFYDFTYELENILVIKARNIKGYKNYVEHYYEIKNQAKKDGNSALQANAKLILNGAYGKLSERSDRAEIRHEINKETGCVHQVEEKADRDNITYSGLSIIQGAYVTALARIKIMRYIIDVCGDNLVDEFIYVDTDSVHAFKEYTDADPYKLGALKLEAKCYCGKFLGKKLYAEFETVDKCVGEVHSKGCNITKVCASILSAFNVDKMEHLDFMNFCKKFSFGERFTVNAGLNVRGGKCILPVDKDLIKDCRLKENTIRLARIGDNEFNEV